jgi:hypothetical protein
VTPTTYWISKTFVGDWVLTDPTTGVFIAGATVIGTVTKPDLSTAAMTVTNLADRYRATYDPTMAGLHAYRLSATGTTDGAEEGTFTVHRSLLGALPITVDPTTSIGQVRLLCTDLDEVSPLFTDAHITAFLAMESANIRLAAAQALDTIASSEAMVSKKIRTQDLQTDGPAVAAELRERAASLRKQAADVDPATGEPFAFDIVDYDPNLWLLNGV